jgi:AcrR family transcriptional regulator
VTVNNPLFDTLFRPTTVAAPSVASAAPVRAKGVHSRAGNAMNRTRTALLTGAARAVESSGTKITMAQVATAAGVAKATLYNHFRTREAVLEALLLDQVRAVVDDQAGKALDTALHDAAIAIARHPVRRGLARLEPATLAALGCVDITAEPWQYARAGVAAALAAAGRGGTDTVLRWLSSYLLTPAGPTAIAADVAVLLSGLPAVEAVGRPGVEPAGRGPDAVRSA